MEERTVAVKTIKTCLEPLFLLAVLRKEGSWVHLTNADLIKTRWVRLYYRASGSTDILPTIGPVSNNRSYIASPLKGRSIRPSNKQIRAKVLIIGRLWGFFHIYLLFSKTALRCFHSRLLYHLFHWRQKVFCFFIFCKTKYSDLQCSRFAFRSKMILLSEYRSENLTFHFLHAILILIWALNSFNFLNELS